MKQAGKQVSQDCRGRIGLVSCQTAWPPTGGPSVHIYQVWHRLQRMGYEVHTWGQQAVPGSRPYPRTEAGLASLLANVDVLYVRFWFDEDFTIRIVARLLANRRMPTICEFNAPLYETTAEWPAGRLWTLRHKAVLYGRNHLLVRNCVDHAICVSNVMADYVRREFGLQKITVLPNGGDPELFTPALRAEGRAAMGVTDDDFVVFWGGSTVFHWQGLDQVMQAAGRMQDDRVKFVIAGDTAHLPKPLPTEVLPVGRLSYFDIPRFMAGSDVCLSIYRDYDWCPIGFFGSALKLFDYMASGRAVIASNMGQIREVVQDGENGLLTDGSPQDIADKIESLRRNRDRAEAMGRAARETVVHSYNWQNVAERTGAVVHKVLRNADTRKRKAGRGRAQSVGGARARTARTIGFFAPYEAYGGTEEYLNKLMRPVAEMGYKVVFFHHPELPRGWIEEVSRYATVVPHGCAGNGAAANEAPRRGRPGGLRRIASAVHRRLTPRSIRFLLGFARDAWRLRRLFRQWPVDVLHAPDLGVEPFIAAAKAAGVPRVTGALGCTPRTDGFYAGPANRILEALCLSLVDEIAAVSAVGRNVWLRRARLNPRKVRVVYNGIQPGEIGSVKRTSTEVRREFGIPPEARVIGVSAALVPRKGHRYLLAAFPPVLKAVPDAWILLAGDGPCRAELETQARRLGISGKVTFLGHRTDMGRVVQAYDVVALTSVAVESMPFALLEGMSYGKPVVATAVGGIPELVEDGVSGYVVPPGNSGAIGEALVRVLEDPSRTARMGRAAFERVRSDFSIDTMIQETLDLMLGPRPVRCTRDAPSVHIA